MKKLTIRQLRKMINEEISILKEQDLVLIDMADDLLPMLQDLPEESQEMKVSDLIKRLKSISDPSHKKSIDDTPETLK